MLFFYKLLVFRPVLVLFVISSLSITAILTALLLKSPPDFSDPTLGFEARGTEISKKITTWRNLLEETRPSGSLVVNPKEIQQHDLFKKHRKNKARHEKKKKKLKFDKKMKILREFATSNKSFDVHIDFSEDIGNDTTLEEHNHDTIYGTNKSYDEETVKKDKQKKNKVWKILNEKDPPITSTDFHSTDGFFCESPSKLSLTRYLHDRAKITCFLLADKEYIHFVIKRVRWNINESMFDANALLSMCELERKITDTDGYENVCQKEISSNNCCRPWSLPNYVALLSNKTSCFDINVRRNKIVTH
jgi:protein dispatched 1